MALALGVLSTGLVVRVLDGPLVVLGGTLVSSAGIALANVLIPVVVKDNFPARIGLTTGVYTAALTTIALRARSGPDTGPLRPTPGSRRRGTDPFVVTGRFRFPSLCDRA